MPCPFGFASRYSPPIGSLLVTALLASCTSPPAASPVATVRPTGASSVLAFADVEVVPMDRDQVLHAQTVLIERGVITKLGDAASTPIPAGATVIDGHGRFLVPGLADMHVHLYDAEGFPSYLAYGVTTVANLNGSPADLALRDAVARGAVVGPTIYTAGPSLNGDPPGNATFVAVMDPASGRAVVDDQVRAGYDFIKVYSTLDAETYDAINGEARAKGIAVLGHVPFCVGVARAVASYQSDVAHAEELNQFFDGATDEPARLAELVKLFVASGADGAHEKWLTPNLVAYSDYLRSLDGLDAVLANPEMAFASPALYSEKLPISNRSVRSDPAGFADALRRGHALFQRITRAFAEAGVPLLVGTDTEVFGFPGKSAELELRELEAAGLSRYQVMVAATRSAGEYVARWVHPAERFGVVAPGYRADLMLLDGNPLESLDHLRAMRGVVLRGTWLPRERLDAMRRARESADTPLRQAVLAVEQMIVAERFDDAVVRLEALHREHPEAKLLAEIVLSRYARRATKKAPAAAVRMRELNVALYPDSFSVHTDAARTYLAVGDTASARKHLDAAVAMSPEDAVAQGLREQLGLTGIPPAFDPAGRYDLTVEARQGLCGTPRTLHVTVDVARSADGTYGGTMRVVPETAAAGAAAAASATTKPEPLTGVKVGGDHLWLQSGGPDLRLVLGADGKTVRGRYVGGFAANFPLSGTRSPPR